MAYIRVQSCQALLAPAQQVAARNETDLEALSAQVVDIVQETVQPEQVLLWLKPLKYIDRL